MQGTGQGLAAEPTASRIGNVGVRGDEGMGRGEGRNQMRLVKHRESVTWFSTPADNSNRQKYWNLFRVEFVISGVEGIAKEAGNRNSQRLEEDGCAAGTIGRRGTSPGKAHRCSQASDDHSGDGHRRGGPAYIVLPAASAHGEDASTLRYLCYGCLLCLPGACLAVDNLPKQRRWTRIARRRATWQMDPAETGEVDAEPQTEESRGLNQWLEWLLDTDEFFLLVLAAAGAVSIFFVIWHLISAIAFAPEFWAEVFLDGVFTAALYGRLSRIEHRHWLRSAFGNTKALFLWTLLFFAFVAVVSRHYAPEAISIGGVVRHLNASW